MLLLLNKKKLLLSPTPRVKNLCWAGFEFKSNGIPLFILLLNISLKIILLYELHFIVAEVVNIHLGILLRLKEFSAWV